MGKTAQPNLQTRPSLLQAVGDPENADKWDQFFHTYRPLIYGFTIKAGLSDSEAEDIVQGVFVELVKKMPGFRYDPARGAFKSWLMQLTRWRITDHIRKRRKFLQQDHRSTSGRSRSDGIELIPDPNSLDWDAAWEKEWQQIVYDKALRQLKTLGKQYQIFRLVTAKGWTTERVAATLGVSKSQVYSACCKVRALVKEEIKRLETDLI